MLIWVPQVWSGKWMGAPCALKIMDLRNLGEDVRQALQSGVERNYAKELTHLHVIRTFHVYQHLEPVHQFNGSDNSPTHDISFLWMVQVSEYAGIITA